MLKVWNRRERWDELESMEAFCLTVCRNVALDKMKRAEQQNTSLDQEMERQCHETAHWADTSYAANPEEQTVQLDRLPEKQRTCMQLRDVEGKSYKEIALVMGITEQQVKTNIFRARQTVKQKFQQLEQHGL